jgi:hypothetical protein
MIAKSKIVHLEGFEAEWKKSNNPVHVWSAMAICLEREIPLPLWVNKYIQECASRVLNARFETNDDVRKILPDIFGFVSKRGHTGHFSSATRKLRDEQFSMAFAAKIFEGLTPENARKSAGEETFAFSDRVERRILRSYFGLCELGKDNEWWRVALARWFLANSPALFYYRERYPNIPDLLPLLVEVSKAQGGSTAFFGYRNFAK